MEQLRADITCSICLETLNDPISIDCGHNFCRGCLLAHWSDGSAQGHSCPECQAPCSRQRMIPDMRLKSLVEKITEHLQQEPQGSQEAHPAKPGGEAASGREELTLDPATAHPLLEISPDGKEVRCGSFMRTVRASLRRFDTANCVVAQQSFSTGRHYWEVLVGRKPRWNLGVVSDHAERRGRLIRKKSWWPWSDDVVCTEGYWLIGYNEQEARKKYWAFDISPIFFNCSHQPQKIRVFLDYEAEEVSFYGADDPCNLVRLYSFYHADFKNAPVYPIFDPCWHDKGGNNHPIRIL